MGTLGQKLDYLTDTKSILKQKINNLGGSLTDQSTFRSYGDYLDELYDEMPKVTGEGTEITLTPTRKGRMQLDLKGNTSQYSTTGKNLANLSILDQVPSTTNGKLVTFSGSVCTELIEIDNTKDIVFSFSQTENRQKYVMFYGENQNYLGYSLGMQTNWLLSNNSNYSNSKYVRIRFDSKSTTNWCQLEYNSTATDYEPYTGGQPSPNPDYPQPIHVVTGNNTISIGNTNYPINLGSLEFCKIGDYQDEIFKNELNNPHYDSSLVEGGWYKYGAIGKTVLDENSPIPTEGYEGLKNYFTAQYRNYITNVLTPSIFNNNFLCNRFIANITDAGSEVIGASIIRVGSKYLSFRVLRSFCNSVNDFAEYVANNNIIILYILESSTITQITDETLIAQLDAIENAMSTTGTTTITQTNADLPFIISASALTPFTTETLTTSLTDGE